MYKNYTIACVVLNYNDYSQTSLFIKAASKSKYLDYIIVVDNKSTDKSFELLNQMASDKVIVKETDKNGGYGYGNNFGSAIAFREYSADYTMISNPDVIFDDVLISAIVDAFIDNKKAAVISAVQVNGFTNKEIENCAWRIPTYWDYLQSSLLLINRFKKNRFEYDKSKKIVPVGCVPGAFLGVNSYLFNNIGGYDERVFLFCEESILGFKVRHAGYSTLLLTSHHYLHYHSTSLKKSIPQEIMRHKMVLNSRMFYIKNYLVASKIKVALAMIVFKISEIEYKLFYGLRRQVIRKRY